MPVCRWSCFATALLVAALAALAGCSAGVNEPVGSTLIYAQAEDPKTLDPINTDIAEATHVITNVFDTLVTYHDETTEMVPSLAESWEQAPDGLTWIFRLRSGVKFHDGTNLDAAAVKTSLERLIQAEHPLVFDRARPYQSAYNMIAAIETPDDFTVVLRLKHPSATLLSNLAMFPASIVSPAALEKRGANFATNPIGTGPFRFVKWSRDQQLVCAAFADHWRGAPQIEQLIWVPVRENATRVQRLARGEVHVAESLAPAELDQLAANPHVVVQEQAGLNVAYLTFQMERPPLDHYKVRRAIYQAIDKRALIQIGYGGHAAPAHSMVPPAMWSHDASLVDLSYDPAAARKLLAEAAAEAGFTLPLSLTLAAMNQARPYLPQPVAIQGYLKDALREIGIDLRIETRDVNQHFEHLMAGRHQLGLAGWNSDNGDPDNFLYSLLDSDNINDSGNNLSRYRSERFHELMLAGQREIDRKRRLPLYREAQQLVLADLPVVPLVHTKLRAASAKSLQGYRLHPTGLVRLRTAYFDSADVSEASAQ